MEMKMIPAPIDEKNVTSDWIEDVFDGSNCVCNDNTLLGFIKDCPVIAAYYNNVIVWKFINESSEKTFDGLLELKKRLDEYDKENHELVTVAKVIGSILIQRFYFTNDN